MVSLRWTEDKDISSKELPCYSVASGFASHLRRLLWGLGLDKDSKSISYLAGWKPKVLLSKGEATPCS
jgi:hypothetical protein